LLDLGLPDSKGLDTFIKLQAEVPDVPIIILTGNTDQDAAVTAVREGAQDYLIKGQISGSTITRAISYAVERKRAEVAMRQSEEKYRSLVDNIEIGVSLISPEMKIIALNKKMMNWFPNVDVATEPVCYRAFNSPPREGTCSYCPTCKTLQDGMVHESITETPTGDTMRNYRVVSSPVRDGAGKVIAALEMVEDITERKSAEDALRKSEARYRSLFENMLEGYAYCKMLFSNDKPEDFIYLHVNAAFETLTGLKNVVGKKVSEVIPGIKESDPGLIEPYGRVALTGKPERFETYVQGLQMWFSISVYSPEKEFFVAVFDVITERKRAEETLRESEEKYRHLVENLGKEYFFYRHDNEGIFTYVSSSMTDMLGYSQQEIFTHYSEYLTDNPVNKEVVTHTDLSIQGHQQPSYDVEIYHRDGSARWLEVTEYPIRGPAGNVIAVEGIAKDITERKRAESALAEKEARLRLLVETIPDMIWLKDVDGRYLSCNKMFGQLIGTRESEIVGKTDYDFVVKELANFIRDHDRKAMTAGKPSSRMEWVTFASDGHRAFLNTIKTPMFDAEGKIVGVLGIGRDITEYQKLEEQLRHAQKMESIGTLAGGIAHDFNNILSAIIGYGHVTLMKMPKDDPLRMNIEHILESADRAAALTQSLLAFSRKQIIDRKPVDLNNIIKKVEKFLVRVIGEDVEVRMALEKTTLTLFADAGQLEQVFMNLATNARDAMPHGGSFTIETAIIELDNRYISLHGYGKKGTYALISATDTGVGMNEETRKKIFEPFFTTKEVGKGTGLGLAMVYGILKQHEGFINVYSEPGKGTTFKIYLPLIKTEAMEELRIIEAEYTKGGTETILLAEDDASVRKLTILVLEQMGYTVIVANDGEEAVTKFMENKDRIQLLLFDIIMPKMNGREAYEEIKKTKPDIPVIFASGYSPDMLRVKALVDDEAVLVYKPISPQSLLKKVREVLDRK
jgi:PAS domain S-box-containing protein